MIIQPDQLVGLIPAFAFAGIFIGAGFVALPLMWNS